MPSRYALRSVRVPLSPLERFSEFLRSRGKRLTKQRRLIVEQVFSHHDHFDVEELLEHLQYLLARREVSRPTVYRTLAELDEAGLLKKMSLGGRNVYEHDYGYPQHDHLYCQSCNRLIEFHSKEIARLCGRVAEEYDFQISSHRLFVTGRCAECRRQGLLPSSAESPSQDA
jgi:Fur family ferric uptake transcriptional regulator